MALGLCFGFALGGVFLGEEEDKKKDLPLL
jgi:hypothetical protein